MSLNLLEVPIQVLCSGCQKFEGLGWVTHNVGQVQNSIITTGVLISEPDKKSCQSVYVAVCSKNGFMSENSPCSSWNFYGEGTIQSCGAHGRGAHGRGAHGTLASAIIKVVCLANRGGVLDRGALWCLKL